MNSGVTYVDVCRPIEPKDWADLVSDRNTLLSHQHCPVRSYSTLRFSVSDKDYSLMSPYRHSLQLNNK